MRMLGLFIGGVFAFMAGAFMVCGMYRQSDVDAGHDCMSNEGRRMSDPDKFSVGKNIVIREKRAVILEVAQATCTNPSPRYLIEFEDGGREVLTKKLPKFKIGDLVWRKYFGEIGWFYSDSRMVIRKIKFDPNTTPFDDRIFEYLVEEPSKERHWAREYYLVEKK